MKALPKFKLRNWFSVLPSDIARAQEIYDLNAFIWRAYRCKMRKSEIASMLGPAASVKYVQRALKPLKRSKGPGVPPIEKYLADNSDVDALALRCWQYRGLLDNRCEEAARIAAYLRAYTHRDNPVLAFVSVPETA